MSGGRDAREALARYLRQAGELADAPVFLDALDRTAAIQGVGRHASGRDTVGTTNDGPAAMSARMAGAVVGEAPSGQVGSAYHELRDEALACTRCRLCEGRTQVVFADGVPTARLMVIGEAPGAQEDRTGLPFVGPAGKLLDLMLASVDLSRGRNVYICNVLKCRPPGNRNPEPDEIERCAPYLRRQIELVAPEVILAVGTFAAQWLTDTKAALGKIRGSVYQYQGVPVVVTYHPAALLRNSGWSRATWDDLQLLRGVLDRA